MARKKGSIEADVHLCELCGKTAKVKAKLRGHNTVEYFCYSHMPTDERDVDWLVSL